MRCVTVVWAGQEVVEAEGLLRVHPSGADAEKLLSWFRHGEDYHISDIHLFWGDIQSNFERQVKSWWEMQDGKPADGQPKTEL